MFKKLCRVNGVVTVDYLATSLGIDINDVWTFISILLAEGLIDEVVVEGSNACVKCALKNFCFRNSNNLRLNLPKLRHYRLTDKGLNLCNSLRD